jgi:hypothetical protein
MKTTESRQTRNRLSLAKSYTSYSRPYGNDIDVLDTDEDVVMQQIDLLDTDEDIVMHYYNNSITRNKIGMLVQNRRKAEAKRKRA